MEFIGTCFTEGSKFSSLYDYLNTHIILEKDEIEELNKLILQ